MEGKQSYSEESLRNSGASALYVAYYQAASASASARREVESGPFTLEELNASPELGGGFFAALWNGNETQALRRADSRNAKILKEVTGKTREDTF